MSAAALLLSFGAGLIIVGVTIADVVGTLVVTGTAGVSGPTRLYYHYTWAAWRGVGRRVTHERRRERWLSLYGPMSMLSLLVIWLAALAVGWALIYQGLLRQVHGSGDFVSLLYYSSASLLAPGFGEVTPETAWAGMLTLVETGMGFGSIALLISYLPVLYGAYNRREARLLTLDDPLGERISPVRVIVVHTLDGDLNGLYRFFAEWELWTAEILESHVSYPMLAYFRSQHTGQSWITALGVVLDAAVLTAAVVPGADQRHPYFMYRRGQRAILEIGRRLQASEGKDLLNRDMFAVAYANLKAAGLPLDDFEAAWGRLATMRQTYGSSLQGLMEYLIAPPGFWGHSAELGVEAGS